MKAMLLTLTLLSTLFASPQNCEVEIDTSKKSLIKDKRVKKAIITLKSTLQKKLKKAIKDKGIINAAKFCNANALSITQDINDDLGKKVSIKRISAKPRNPENQADQSEEEVLNTFLKTHSKEMVKRKLDNKTTRYYQPMYINKPICLKCHGDIKKTSAMGSFLAEHYPDDKATGYKMGDFRGAMVIDVIR
jgi:hypothetical protein